jgi:hypothetical protein
MLYIFDKWETKAFFGEMFGSLDALFSGLAFAGLIYTIHLQRKDLQLQREELRLTRDELQRTATAQEKSEEALNRQADTLLLTARFNLMASILTVKRAYGMMSVNQDFIDEMETELERLNQEFQRRKTGADAPRDH